MLDIACGPGAWALDVAQAFPQKRVTGIDISRMMVQYAKAEAREKGLYNASFQVMDALKPLAFADDSFDLVNARFITGFMSKAASPILVRECMRILRPGGILRLTECESPLTNSVNMGVTTQEEANRLYLQTLEEMQSVDFCGVFFFLTAWGTKPA